MNKKIIYILILAIFFAACSNTKYLHDGEKLYTGAVVKIEKNKSLSSYEKKSIKEEMNALLLPKPNASFLGLRIKLFIYNKTQTTKTKGIQHWLNNKFGEPPVLLSSVDVNKNSEILQNRLQNEGYFNANIVSDTIQKKKTGSAIYTIQTGDSYTIDSVIFPRPGNDSLLSAIARTSRRTLLKKGNKYNLDIIKNERTRIDARLKNQGFYYFSPDDILMRVDSSKGNHQVAMYVTLKNTTPEKATKVYHINNIYVYPRYSLRDTSKNLEDAKFYKWYYVVDSSKSIRPIAFENTVQLHPGDVYSRIKHNNSLNRFVNLGPYKFVKNTFQEVNKDSAKLDAYYFLTPYKTKSLQLDVLGRTTSANYAGSQVNINWRNRNAFKGAEALSVTLFGSTDVQFGGQNNGYNVYQAGIQTSISWPRFISPFKFKADNAYIPHTNLTLGYSFNKRIKLYTLNSFTGSFGYQWRENAERTHELNLLNITYVDAANVSQLYKDSIASSDNPTLAHVIDKQFTFGPSYSYTVTNTAKSYKRNTYYFNGKVDLSANIYGIVSGANIDQGNIKKLFGQPFDQFVKLQTEYRYYHKIGPKSSLAGRVFLGVGLPYGNSTILPYSDQFFIGGSNSLRGFRARALGPGIYYAGDPNENGNFYPDESGDIKMEANLEYRPHLFSIVQGALFADAGNIWLYHSNPDQPGAQFSSHFIHQLAADMGAGLRIDATVLVLRIDLGMPIRKPWLPEGQRWVFNQIDFGSSQWRKSNLILNIAIGYPF
ncbi:BamA/TamA family outer membrane protein [Arachidicoccus sp.]|uniref:translocation and assembly module lipoprotein TamL n=1 Tax=Arachidicoccus sp. TaxID=1872624 RepID=UPI003D21C32A